MEPNTSPRARGTALTLLLLCLAGALLAPVAVYLFGSSLMGPYEGDGGLAGFMTGVFSAAVECHYGALALLLTPAGLVLTWWLIFQLLKPKRLDPEIDTD